MARDFVTEPSPFGSSPSVSPAGAASVSSRGPVSTPAIIDVHRRKLASITAVWEKCGQLNGGEVSFLIRMAGVQLAEPRAIHAEDIAWAREIRDRWLKVRPQAVCGGSDAQAINVFTEALSDLLGLSAIVSAAAQAIEVRRTETQSGSARESAVGESRSAHE